jgi:hypothetical protein
MDSSLNDDTEFASGSSVASLDLVEEKVKGAPKGSAFFLNGQREQGSQADLGAERTSSHRLER